jgi:hypothetical protein
MKKIALVTILDLKLYVIYYIYNNLDYGPRPKDSFEMHKNFIKPSENTYEF